VPREFDPNAFWYTFTGNYQYYASHSKGTIIYNPCIGVAQCVLPCGLFAQEGSLKVPRVSKLHFVHSML